MRRRTIAILLAVAIPVAALGSLALLASIEGILTISTDKAIYRQGETITFTVRNNGFSTLEFPDPGLGFRIINLDTGEDVNLGWLHPQVISSMGPLTSQTIRWDQTESTRSQDGTFGREPVKLGNYAAKVGTAGFEPRAVAEVKFQISVS